MAREFARKFYDSKAWEKCREGYIASVYGLCRKCKDKPGYILHHKVKLTPENIGDPDITLNWENLEYLCLVHHNAAHGGNGELLREGLAFDESGMLVRVG